MKKFAREDLTELFSNTEFKKIPGKSPELVFLDEDGAELERLDIVKFKRQELIQLLDDRGIPRKRDGGDL